MILQSSNKLRRNQRIQDDAGAYLVMYTVILAFLLVFGGLVVDGARLFRANRAIQKAADAAVLAGLAYRAEIGAAADPADMESVACSTFWANVRRDNIVDMTNASSAKNTVIQACSNATDTTLVSPNYPDPGANNLALNIVNVALDVPLYFIDRLPWRTLGVDVPPSGIQSVSTTARSRINPTKVVLVLDLSGSMRCPRNQDCSCLRPDTPDCPLDTSPSSKSRLLKEAAYEFSDRFTNGYDFVSLVTFNMRQQTLIDGGTIHNSNNFRGALEPVLPSSNTNPSEALLAGNVQLNSTAGDPRAALIPDANKALLFFTDGSPTAMTFAFSGSTQQDVEAGVPINSQAFVSYKAQFTDPNSGLISAFPSAVTRVQPLDGATPGVLYDHAQALPTGITPVNYNAGVPSIDLNTSTTGTPDGIDIVAPCTDQPIYATNQPDRFLRAFSRSTFAGTTPGPVDCLSGEGYLRTGNFCHGGSIPYWEGGPFGTNPAGFNTADAISRHFEEMYYNAAIAAADTVRLSGATPRRIYAVGLGIPAQRFPDLNTYDPGFWGALNASATRPFGRGQDGTNKSPYQLEEDVTSRDDGNRRDYFLARIANDPFAVDFDPSNPCHLFDFVGNSTTPNPATCSLAVDFNGDGYENGGTSGCDGAGGILRYEQLPPPSRGEYLPTRDPAELRPLFGRIAKQIVLRLIE